jgi:hypothetical protein
MKKIIILSIIIVNFSLSQEGGSLYSRYGIGLMIPPVNVRSLGMGGTNIAFFDFSDINNFNPASWGKIKFSSFSGSFDYQKISLSDNEESKSYSHFNFYNANLGIPIDQENGIVLGVGIEPLSKISYNVKNNSQTGDLNTDFQYYGRGGLSEAFLGLTYSPLQNLYLGVKPSYLFGEMNYAGQVYFNGQDNYYDSKYSYSTYIKGFAFTGALIYSGLGKILHLNECNIGLVYSPPANSKGRKELSSTFLTTSGETVLDTVLIPDGDIKLPSTFGVGLNLGLSERLNIGFDYVLQNWSNFSIMGERVPEIKNSFRLSLGAELAPEKDLALPFLQRLFYRFGGYYNKLNYKIQNNDIDEVGFSIGMGIPLSRISLLNTSFTYGWRGSKNDNLILENFFKVHISLSVSELWFVSPEEY